MNAAKMMCAAAQAEAWMSLFYSEHAPISGSKKFSTHCGAVAEFEDARRYNSQLDRDNRDINEFELIQGYMELHFKDALGYDDRGNARPPSSVRVVWRSNFWTGA